jgi:hypothetical protein
MAKHSAERIAAKANELSQAVPPHLSGAAAYVDQYADLPGTAFGVFPQLFLAGPYREARSTQLQNLRDGALTFDAIVDGLWSVATTFDAAEVANTARKQDKQHTDLVAPTGSGHDLDGLALGAAWLTAGELAITWSASASMKLGISTQCILGFLAAVSWPLVIPDHQALSTAKGAWDAAAEQLQAIGELANLTRFDDDTWSADSPSRAAFDSTVNQFDIELKQAADQAGGMSSGLESVGNTAYALMLAMAITDLVTLITVFILAWFKMFPPTAAAAEVAQDSAAAANGAATTAVVSALGGFVGAFASGALSLAQAGTFTKLEVADENGTYGSGTGEDTFVDVDLDFSSLPVTP